MYIKADGSIEPPTAPIKRDANIYTLTDNISESIVVEKDDIIIDGASHIIQGQGEGIGIKLNNVRNVTIKNVVIKGFGYGIFLNSSSHCSIFGNSITNNPIGIGLLNSCNNSIFANNLACNYFYGIYVGPASPYNNISRNTISRNYCGIYLSSTTSNTILENNVEFNWFGIYIYVSSNNSIFHNNFINNIKQTMLHLSKNTWDNGYPSGGNFWSNYNGTDNYSGLNQNETGNDGIGDTPYLIDSDNTDKYPLIKPWGMGTPTANFTYTPAQPEAGKPITFDASNSKPMGGEIISYQWNFGDGNITTTRKPVLTHTYLTPGTFNATLTIKDSEGLESQAWVLIHVYGHNIAIKKVEPYRSWIYQGLPININVTIVNVGNFTEEATISLYYNITSNSKICQGKITLKPLEIKTITITWNTTGVVYCHNYTITAIAEIEFDSNPSDNILQSSIKIHVRILGDVNGDNKVDMRDIGIAARAFGSYPGHERWNPDVDVNNDNKIDMRDIAISSRNFGKACG
jgi:parallel beta-helix repeat protein